MRIITKRFVRCFPILALMFISISAGSAYALGLDEGKAKGLVGEQQNGYLGAVSGSPAADVSALVADINRQRKAKYQEIATKNGTTVTAVELLAAKKAIQGTAAGNYVQNEAGAWVRK